MGAGGQILVKWATSVLLVVFLLLPASKAGRHQVRQPWQERRDKELRFLMVPNVLGSKASLLSDLGKDLNNIYSGYANVTGGFFPFLLKGSTYTDTIYGALGNRSGMIIVGAALLGGTGYYFLNEINAVPSLEGMARMITRTSNSLVGAVTGYFKSIQTSILTSRSETIDTTHDRIDDIMYSLPGPPYNYDIKTVLNTTKWRFRGQPSETTGDRRGDTTGSDSLVNMPGSSTVEEGDQKDFTTIDKHLGVPVDDLAYHSVELPSEEPNFIPLLRKTKGASDKFRPKKYLPRKHLLNKTRKRGQSKKQQHHRGWHSGGGRTWRGGGCVGRRCVQATSERRRWGERRGQRRRYSGVWKGTMRRQRGNF